jgi:hypothetical protein
MDNKNWQDIIRQMYLKVTQALREGGSIENPDIHPLIEPRDVWARLTEEGNHDLIKTLHRIERKDPGYSTIVTHKEGWSNNDATHNAVLSWLRAHDVNILNVGKEVECLTRALHQPQEVE